MLAALALSSVVLLAGCNNAPAEEEILDENNEPEIEIVVDDEEPEIVVIPADDEAVLEDAEEVEVSEGTGVVEEAVVDEEEATEEEAE